MDTYQWQLQRHYDQMLSSRLQQYGAATFGSTRRREQRLDRFREVEIKKQEARMRLEEAREQAQAAVRRRAAIRANEILARAEQETFCLSRLWSAIQNGFVNTKRG